MISKILHRCVPAQVTEEFEGFWQKWKELMPDWEFKNWQDPIDPKDFPMTSHLWPTCLHGAQMAGLIRLEAIYHYGGIYMDMDFRPYRSLEPLTYNGAFIGTEDGIHLTDAAFGAMPDHPAIKACLDEVLKMDMKAGALATGPHLTTRVLTGRPDCAILPVKTFYPYLYTERHRREEDFSNVEGCFAAHLWNWSWKDKA